MTRLDVWLQLQANGLRAYREIPEASCALAWRRDVQQFKRFIGKQDGLTLDIGCGIEVPGYLDKHNLKYTVGVDPLPAVANFHPMRRYIEYGETLQFQDEMFRLVILAGTIDHVIDPGEVLSEARRVLRPNGRLVVQIGIPGSDPRPRPVKTLQDMLQYVLTPPNPRPQHLDRVRQVVGSMPIPVGCPDPFHFKYYTEAEIETLFTAAQLTIARRKRIPGSTFYELRK